MFASWMIEPVLVSIVWFVKDMKSNLGAAGIWTHDFGSVVGHSTTEPTFLHWTV